LHLINGVRLALPMQLNRALACDNGPGEQQLALSQNRTRR
jgi:hypothetical protein